MALSRRLRVLSWNTWHALNPYARVLMRPMENPIARIRRLNGQLELLSHWCASPSDVICLQEVNPVKKRVEEIGTKLCLRGEGIIANTGIKCGRFGLPPFLQEGEATWIGEAFTEIRFRETTLSGHARERTGPLGVPLTFQLAERRKALLFEGTLEGKRIAVVNLHLHHGPDAFVGNPERRREELVNLKKWLESRISEWDLAIVCGDFNCDPDSRALEPLFELGFRDSAELSGVSPQPTWDARANSLTALSPQCASTPEERAWDEAPHVFDRIYVLSRETLEKVSYSQIREPSLSDHFGVSAEFRF